MKILILSIYDCAYGFDAMIITDNSALHFPQNEIDEWESRYMTGDQSLMESAFQQGYDRLIICEDGCIRYYDKNQKTKFAIMDIKTENIKVR